MRTRHIFITGGTGYMGQRLIPELLRRGHTLRCLARPASGHKLPSGCLSIIGNALEHDSFVAHVPPADTFVHLVGVSHPSPAKAKEFRAIDLASVRAAVATGVQHFVYLSVAQPAPVMKAYVQARAEGEALIRESGLNATFLRPWYVLGPGHRWPSLLRPWFWLFERLPATRDTAKRLGLVTLKQMINTLVWAVENPAPGVRLIQVEQIRSMNQGRGQ